MVSVGLRRSQFLGFMAKEITAMGFVTRGGAEPLVREGKVTQFWVVVELSKRKGQISLREALNVRVHE